MKQISLNTAYFGLFALLLFLQSCGSSVRLSATWDNPQAEPYAPKRIITMAIGENLKARNMAEQALRAELEKHGFTAIGALEIFPFDFNQMDSAQLVNLIILNDADALLTARLVDESTSEYWVPGYSSYATYPAYSGFYGYYNAYGVYHSPGYMATETEVLLESNLYSLEGLDKQSGPLLWVGQSDIFVSGSTEKLLAKYAYVVVRDLIDKGIITP